jgi:hypothetical protein
MILHSIVTLPGQGVHALKGYSSNACNVSVSRGVHVYWSSLEELDMERDAFIACAYMHTHVKGGYRIAGPEQD